MMFDISIDSYCFYRMYTIIRCSDVPSLLRLSWVEGATVDCYEVYLAGRVYPMDLVPIIGDSILSEDYKFSYDRVWIV